MTRPRFILALALSAVTSAVAATPSVLPPPLAPLAPVTDPSEIFAAATGDPHTLKRALRGAFSDMLGSPAKLTLDVDWGRPSERLRGYFGRISVHFEGGALDTLGVAEATLEATDVHYDLAALLAGERPLPRQVGETRFDMRVTEAALNETLNEKRRNLGVSDPELTLGDDEISFSGGIRLLFFNQRIDLKGQAQVRGEGMIDFRPSRLWVSRLKLPGFVLRNLSRRFNPVLNLNRAPWWDTFHPDLASIEVRPGELRVITEPAPRGPSNVTPRAQVPGGSEPKQGASEPVLRSL